MFMVNPNRDYRSEFSTWWKNLPIYTTILFTITITTSILSMINPFFGFLLMLYPEAILSTYSLWRLLTFPYMCMSPLSAAFSLCGYMPISAKKERLLGTFRFIYSFTIQNLLIGIIFCLFFYIISPLSLTFYSLLYTFLFGLWPCIMHDMVLRCNIDGDEQVPFMCFPVIIKKKWYPWVFFIFFSIFGVFFGLVVGICTGYLGIGYLELYGYLKWTEVSDETAEKWERRTCCLFQRIGGFISVSESGNELPGLRPVQISEPRGGINNVAPPRSQPQPFSGTGYRLGGDDQPSPGFSSYFKNQSPNV